MKNNYNQENMQQNGGLTTRRHHVSQESMPKPFKPTIKYSQYNVELDINLQKLFPCLRGDIKSL